MSRLNPAAFDAERAECKHLETRLGAHRAGECFSQRGSIGVDQCRIGREGLEGIGLRLVSRSQLQRGRHVRGRRREQPGSVETNGRWDDFGPKMIQPISS